MTLLEALAKFLDTNISALGSRIDPIRLRDKPTYPALTYQRLAPQFNPHLNSGSDLYRVPVQLTIWSKRFSETQMIGTQIIQVIEGYRGTLAGDVVAQGVVIDTDLDEYDPNTLTWQRIIDVAVWASVPA